MSIEESKRSRGRPKTLNREHILDISMKAYWEEGIEVISLNEICKRANVSKPGIYREFGNDDGLLKAVLEHYEKNVITEVQKLFIEDLPFCDTLDKFVSRLTVKSTNHDGCLFIKLRDSNYPLGDETKKEIERIHKQYVETYEKWIQRSKENADFTKDISSKLAANYIDTQVSMAMNRISNGYDVKTMKEILTLSFSIFK
ncbi:TetR/AcrR family transcriptional regulator [Poseidonibacter antarcticus]|uniref:TetR/AcrR family transcriptional regulator n=1 Tax=Poseidonibacter antarcticus TaxID=2478538 RepID=UPI000EF4FFD9|nr:TetR/AcrR family transcriptional regulator [Poseidonibacter antarcticus]